MYLIKKTINLFKVKSLLGLNLYSSIPNFFFELDDYIKRAGFFACLVINLKLCHHSSLLLIIFNNLFYPVSPWNMLLLFRSLLLGCFFFCTLDSTPNIFCIEHAAATLDYEVVIRNIFWEDWTWTHINL